MAQQNTLVKIINADESKEVIQKKIDSFFSVNTDSMSPKELANCYHDVGNKWYHEQWWNHGEKSDIINAITYTKRALEIKAGLKGLEKGSLDNTYYNLGVFYYLKGEIYNAIKTYTYINDNGTDIEWIQNARLELGYLYLTTGDFYKALDRFSEMISLNEGPSFRVIDAQILKAETYAEMGFSEFSNEIQSNLNKADSLIILNKENHQQFKRRIDHLEGNRLLETGEYNLAIAKHKEVLKDSASLRLNDLANINNSIGYSYTKLKKTKEALKHLNKSIAIAEDYSLPYENLGDLYLDQNNFQKALKNYQKAIFLKIDNREDIKIYTLPNIETLELSTEKIFLLSHIIAKANGWLKYYEFENDKDYLKQALKTFRLADQLVDVIRSESTEYQSKLFWREKGASLYTKAVEACFLLKKPEEAFYYMERNKALLLLEDVSNEQAKTITKLPDSIAQREFNLKQAILLSENELHTNPDLPENALKKLRNKVHSDKKSYYEFTDTLNVNFPEYAKLKSNVAILTYDNFKKNYTAEDEVVLQYILNDKQGYGLLSTKNNVQFFKLKNVKNLNQNILELYGSLTDLTMNRTKVSEYNKLSHNIFKQLVPEQVYNDIKGKKLTIIPDYILQQIPFEAFVVENAPAKYFIEDTEIRYAYSMSYLDAKTHILGAPQKELYAVAPIQFKSLGLPSLIFSGAEIEEVNKIFPGNIALKGEATKSDFTANFKDYRIVHLSTHADIGENEDPWIAFSDDKMFLNEIYATRNQAEMVVLSACNTSIGELKKGEGAMSLARGFFHSGAKSVVSSLWSTYDKSSKELMTSFYTALSKGDTKSAAMQKAKVYYINKYRESAIAPAYWSALIVIGDNAPLENQQGFLPFWVWMPLSVLLLVVLYFLFKRKK
ncbi:CHAT domain-containing protein [Zobellia barbeyronii]|uniref:CHAT domain-containing protein n=1 Tax=Zobellia barbeyronii TaxID=2748009 RepID=A0ABS5W9E9_9FLAO|nr:CHAT domain-containing protein [Zobellia barbeyronii]MBT2159626.1 CHAT domain-containing protein [Zobellia barbeyronii]